MHLLVLSAFRLEKLSGDISAFKPSQCTFWCSVLSDNMLNAMVYGFRIQSQCTFWCSVLSDNSTGAPSTTCSVSMHLLVLSAFRLSC